MRLSVITAVYNAIAAGNRERLIRCVESVAALKTNHEHLIYDGASTDGTVELLRGLEAKTPGLKVASGADTGIYNALNKGVRDASGEWFYVLGCDDYIFCPRKMDETLVSASNSVDMIVSRVKDDFGLFVRDSGFVRRNLLFGMPYCHQGVLLRCSQLRSLGGFDERYRICADYALFLKCHLRALRIAFTGNRFAQFAAGGVSGREGGRCGENMLIARDQLGLRERDIQAFKKNGSYTLRSIATYLVHPDPTVRISAWMMVGRWIRGCIFKK